MTIEPKKTNNKTANGSSKPAAPQHADKMPREKGTTKSRSYSQSDLKVIIAESGGYCAFPSCDLYLLTEEKESDGQTFIGKIAHIVGHSRTGPRGDFEVPDDDLDAMSFS